MKPRYFQVSLGCKVGPPIGNRSRGRRLKIPYDLLKWKISVFTCLMMRPKLSRSLESTLLLQKRYALGMSKDLFCAMIRLSSTNKRMEIGVFRFLRCFSRIYKNGVRYKADKIGKRADP